MFWKRKKEPADFTLDDFRKQMGTIKKMGSMRDIMKMIPGLGRLIDDNPDMDAEKDMKRIEGIVDAMTPAERHHPERIDPSRCNRIASGAGVGPSEVNRLVTDFIGMASKMKEIAGMGMRQRRDAIKRLKAQESCSPPGETDPAASQKRKRRKKKRRKDDDDFDPGCPVPA